MWYLVENYIQHINLIFLWKRILFHGNNKTIDEIKMGVDLGVGVFVVDNFYELDILDKFM